MSTKPAARSDRDEIKQAKQDITIGGVKVAETETPRPDLNEVLKQIYELVAPDVDHELREQIADLTETVAGLRTALRMVVVDKEKYRIEAVKLRSDLSTIKELLP